MYASIANNNVWNDHFKGDKHIGVGIGKAILDLSVVTEFYPPDLEDVLKANVLNPLMALNPAAWKTVRKVTQNILLQNSELDKNVELKNKYVNEKRNLLQIIIKIIEFFH